MRAWQAHYPSARSIRISVNRSAQQLRHTKLAEEVAHVLEETQLAPQYLQPEITESLLMGDAEALPATLQELKALGVQLAIDDFGTGYSSLNYLKRFPVDVLKIDRGLIEGLSDASGDPAIVRAVSMLAHTLSMQVVAEGTETAEQLALLQPLGCEVGQGFYFSEPLPGEAVGALLAVSARVYPPYLTTRI